MTQHTHLGTCPHCFRTFAADAKGNLVRHGWRESGQRRQGSYGNVWHSGGCNGSKAFEVSAVQTLEFAARLQAMLEQRLANPVAKPADMPYHKQDGEYREARRAYGQWKHDVETLPLDIAMLIERAKAWKPRKLADRKKVERAEKKASRAKAQKLAAERKAKRDEKAAKKAAREKAQAEATEKLIELFKNAEPGTIWSLSALKKITGASKGIVEDVVYYNRMGVNEGPIVSFARDTSVIEERFFGHKTYKYLGTKVERLADDLPRDYYHHKVAE